MDTIIEGTAVEVEPERALVVRQPGQALVSHEGQAGPRDMIEVATHLATALKDIVERQKLFTVISGKKFPQVEAWMTIGRMDNVVAREAERPIRNDDGSYEAFVELCRLSDGMVIGRASALCGTQDDRPWNNRSEPARRSMAVTRATSRAFRQQYSWIMALAGYEPTPADEMPDERGETHQPASRVEPVRVSDGGLVGEAFTQGTQDFELRQGPQGMALPFRVRQGRGSLIVVAHGSLADALVTIRDRVIGQTVTVWGVTNTESFVKDGKTIRYPVMTLERIQTPDGTLPAVSVAPEPSGEPVEAPSMEAWDLERLDAEQGAA